MLNLITGILKKYIGTRLQKDIAYTFVAQLLIMGLALIVNKVLSVKLGVEGYGQYSIIKKSSAVISFVMLSGMGIALPRFLSKYVALKDLKHAKSIVVSSILVVLIASVTVAAFCLIMRFELSPLIIGDNNSQLYYSVLIYAFSITLCSLLYSYFRGAGAFIRFSVSQIIVQMIVTVCAVIFGKDLYVTLNMWTVASISYVLSALFVEKRRNALFKKDKINWPQNILPHLKVLFSYGLPRMVGDFFLFSFNAFPLIYISQNLDIESSSLFAVGITLVLIITPLFSFLGMVLLPYVSSAIAQNKFRQADKLIWKLLVIYVILSFFAILFLRIGVDQFIILFFSRDFLPAANISKILLISIFSESIYLLFRNPIDAASVIPYNSINMLLCFALLIITFYASKSMEYYAVSYLFVSIVKASLSMLVWGLCRKRLLKIN